MWGDYSSEEGFVEESFYPLHKEQNELLKKNGQN